MKNRLIKLVMAVTVLWGMAYDFAHAEEIWVQDITVDKLQELYKACNYDGEKGYLMLPSYRYPAIFLRNFPLDYGKLTDEKSRNALFIKITAPLALKLNEELRAERTEIEKIDRKLQQKAPLEKKDIDLLEQKAEKYDVFSRLKENERYNYLADELLVRIDRIPPSVMITAAALETNWGMSRIVKEAKSLYKMLVWNTDEGLKPLGETEDDSYRIKMYSDVYASMKDFALKINSHPAFAALRNLRQERKKRTNNMSGILLAPYMYGNSNLQNYAGMFDYTLAYYELLVIDKSKLDYEAIDDKILKNFEKYVTKM